eukprot:COSAG06_NODE_57195_length_281_cov_0.851648_1_plen_33_part_01
MLLVALAKAFLCLPPLIVHFDADWKRSMAIAAY